MMNYISNPMSNRRNLTGGQQDVDGRSLLCNVMQGTPYLSIYYTITTMTKHMAENSFLETPLEGLSRSGRVRHSGLA
jgi:hypothetical protein